MSLEIVDHPALEVTGLLFEPGQGEDIAALWRRFADRAGEIAGFSTGSGHRSGEIARRTRPAPAARHTAPP